ncbi:Uu.00g078000.m01.CDS01 [Anthostomella pinea]|uniref:Uu.00g078000.m01.CDS01 n=1 Tax=Anthostomella pinea TaxID=933095 RepID=A0AAI8YGP3_9PEZI|nr:Uu.00g078000.m01.CDS01 [Anthostomella pinea]
MPASSAQAPGLAKRGRATHDVDGPGTGAIPCKKRRIRLHLITSRLSQPYSLPATHIINRETGDDTPVLSRFLKLAIVGSQKVGHQSALVRKAAILNRVRIGVRQAAVSRGHTLVVDMAARGNALNHGLQLVTTSSSSTGAKFPCPSSSQTHQMRPVWRPHTAAFHAFTLETDSSGQYVHGSAEVSHADTKMVPRREVSKPENMHPQEDATTSGQTEVDDETSFPAFDFSSRYIDLSDDDLDDVYADFGLLFGPGARSPETEAVGGDAAANGHFYEEYLDELDGIPWLT